MHRNHRSFKLLGTIARGPRSDRSLTPFPLRLHLRPRTPTYLPARVVVEVSTAHFTRPVNPGSGSCPGLGFPVSLNMPRRAAYHLLALAAPLCPPRPLDGRMTF